MKLPVLDDFSRDAMIIGYASTALEAEQIAEACLRQAGNDDDEIAELKAQGVLTYNFRSWSDTRYNNIDAQEIENGFFDNA